MDSCLGGVETIKFLDVRIPNHNDLLHTIFQALFDCKRPPSRSCPGWRACVIIIKSGQEWSVVAPDSILWGADNPPSNGNIPAPEPRLRRRGVLPAPAPRILRCTLLDSSVFLYPKSRVIDILASRMPSHLASSSWSVFSKVVPYITFSTRVSLESSLSCVSTRKANLTYR